MDPLDALLKKKPLGFGNVFTHLLALLLGGGRQKRGNGVLRCLVNDRFERSETIYFPGWWFQPS